VSAEWIDETEHEDCEAQRIDGQRQEGASSSGSASFLLCSLATLWIARMVVRRDRPKSLSLFARKQAAQLPPRFVTAYGR
jgi:hypothetical protein